MKHISFIILFITAFSLSSYAQTEKGKIFGGINSNIGGFYNSTNHKYKDDVSIYTKERAINHSFGFNFNPELGYFVANNLVVGVDFGYNYSQREEIDIETGHDNNGNEFLIDKVKYKTKSTQIKVGTFLRYYFLKGQFKPFVKANIGLLQSSIKSPVYKYESNQYIKDYDSYRKANALYTGLGAGAAYFINDNLAIEGSFNYNFTSSTSQNRYIEKRDNNLNLNLGFSITF
ncbi:MAG: outer membrane beta-barrel protein [Hyphomicrobiales bacterium]